MTIWGTREDRREPILQSEMRVQLPHELSLELARLMRDGAIQRFGTGDGRMMSANPHAPFAMAS